MRFAIVPAEQVDEFVMIRSPFLSSQGTHFAVFRLLEEIAKDIPWRSQEKEAIAGCRPVIRKGAAPIYLGHGCNISSPDATRSVMRERLKSLEA